MRHIISLKKAAKTWEDGLPIGNGRLGATVLGKINEEMITINEETIWYGGYKERKNPDCRANLEEIKRLLFAGEVQKAQFLAKMSMTSAPKYMTPYQPAGDLKINFPGHLSKRCANRACYLDLDDATAWVKYDFQGVSYVRQHFASQKYNVIVIRLTADTPGMITVSANLNRKPFEENTQKLDDATVCNYGQCGPGGVQYFTALRIAAKGGKSGTMGDFVYAEEADEVTLYVTAGTDFAERIARRPDGALTGEEMARQMLDYGKPLVAGGLKPFQQACIDRLDAAQAAGPETIYEEHLKWYHPLYRETQLTINEGREDLRTVEEQLNELKDGTAEHNDYLSMLLFAFAKYLLISSSSDCRLPANLQGIWNGVYVPPWQSEFTININTEMNYWMAEKCGLGSCHMPLFDLLDRLAANGEASARELYGCGGFVAHHNTNLWANTDPEGIMDASPFWVMGGAWLCLHAYEHYLYTEDMEFLKKRALPVMAKSIAFFKDYLTETEDGYLITGPCVSPENSYLSKIGIRGALCMGPTMDIMILRQLFTWYLEGCEAAGLPKDPQVEEMLRKLPPTRISSDGRIMEWQEEYEEPEPGHRHISHLFGLYPGNEITEETPELFAAAKKTLETRLAGGGGHTGWSRAWVTCFFARLQQGDKVLENIEALLKKSILANLYDTHPPFQIDGNFGIAAAMTEALVQYHDGYIHLLPALPACWKKGSLTGVHLPGRMKADIVWDNGRVTDFVLTGPVKKTVKVKMNGAVREVECRAEA